MISHNTDLLSKEKLESGTVLSPRFNTDGLITAIVQDSINGEILMLAHMNAEALSRTIQEGKAYFWSRSRSKLWLKGETSGNVLEVRELRIDCDQDAIIVIASLKGNGACHTGAHSCFYRKIAIEEGIPVLKKTGC